VREPPASLFYDRKYPASVTLHAAERMRRLAAQSMGYDVPAELDYGVRTSGERPHWLAEGRYIVALHATARPDKAWSEPAWVELAQRAAAAGLNVLLPWGSGHERQRSERIATAAGAVAPPKLGFDELAQLLAGAAAVVGVDTGLTHLASAVGAPVVAIYAASWAEFNGVIGPGFIANLGGPAPRPAWTRCGSAPCRPSRADAPRAPGAPTSPSRRRNWPGAGGSGRRPCASATRL